MVRTVERLLSEVFQHLVEKVEMETSELELQSEELEDAVVVTVEPLNSEVAVMGRLVRPTAVPIRGFRVTVVPERATGTER